MQCKRMGYRMRATIMMFILFAFALVLTVIMAVSQGFVISTLWEWFIVPAFGLPSIGILSAIGFSLLAFILCPTPPIPSEDESRKHVFMQLIKPWFYLFIGYIVKLFMG